MLLKNLEENNYDTPTPIQMQAIPVMLQVKTIHNGEQSYKLRLYSLTQTFH